MPHHPFSTSVAQAEVLERFMNTIMDTMELSYPEIAQNRERILRVERRKVLPQDLESGTHRFDEVAAAAKTEGKTVVRGQVFRAARYLWFPDRLDFGNGCRGWARS